MQLIDSPHAACLTVHSGRTFTLLLEDKTDDLRICLGWHDGARSMSYVCMTNFNPELKAWTKDERRGRIELSTNAGRAKLFKRFEELGNEFALAPQPRILCLYHVNGKWRK